MSEMRITLVQSDPRGDSIKANCTMLDEWLRDVHTTDLIVLPEMFATGFAAHMPDLATSMEENDAIQWMRNLAERSGAVVTGSVAILDHGECFNRLIWACPDGTLDWYDKWHLFRMAGEHQRYGMGQERRVIEIAGFRIFLSICYDLRFPVWQRNIDNEYDALLCVANWPSARRNAWRTLLQARAIENQAYVIGVNRTGEDASGQHYSGDSMLLDYTGEALIDEPQSVPFVRTGTIGLEGLQSYRERFPAWRDADHFSLQPRAIQSE
ncbi:amidohydrolase [Kushneria phosphatilytica]|uniref:Omega-amidase YafV n=1 Tax=Kushneria phosphatilytica TaxID=657387 RepID=A0A1S1NWT1_9GAMM|nr:amidohydrolase [Kushneria phosphatilytica]OHV11887.1 nitrilase family protein [Kushneria phosphatilytica]QEL11059.1 amidohydrolase [Kushneria phosphatilytica]